MQNLTQRSECLFLRDLWVGTWKALTAITSSFRSCKRFLEAGATNARSMSVLLRNGRNGCDFHLAYRSKVPSPMGLSLKINWKVPSVSYLYRTQEVLSSLTSLQGRHTKILSPAPLIVLHHLPRLARPCHGHWEGLDPSIPHPLASSIANVNQDEEGAAVVYLGFLMM